MAPAVKASSATVPDDELPELDIVVEPEGEGGVAGQAVQAPPGGHRGADDDGPSTMAEDFRDLLDDSLEDEGSAAVCRRGSGGRTSRTVSSPLLATAPTQRPGPERHGPGQRPDGAAGAGPRGERFRCSSRCPSGRRCILSLTGFTRIIIVFSFLRQALGTRIAAAQPGAAGPVPFPDPVHHGAHGQPRCTSEALAPRWTTRSAVGEAIKRAEQPCPRVDAEAHQARTTCGCSSRSPAARRRPAVSPSR